MDKKRLEEIRERLAAAIPNIHGWVVTNVNYLDLYRQDVPDLLAYVKELQTQIAEMVWCDNG